jgi:Uma2 family endonuclease
MEGGAVEQTMPQASFKLGLEDYNLFPDDGQRHELIDGEHVVTAAPNSRHQRVVMKAGTALYTYAEAHRLAVVLPAPTDVILSPHDVVQPDLLLVAVGRRDIVRNRVEGPPDLAIEVLSPSSRRIDEMLKRRAYERCGVAELWILDPDIERVRLYRRAEDGRPFGRAIELSAEHGDVLETPLLPGFRIAVAELFADPMLDDIDLLAPPR